MVRGQGLKRDKENNDITEGQWKKIHHTEIMSKKHGQRLIDNDKSQGNKVHRPKGKVQ